MMRKLWPLLFGWTLLTMSAAYAKDKFVTPDPDGLPPEDVRDLSYGDVLYYFYQDDYFDSITRLLAAEELNRLPNTQGEADLLLGGLYLSLGEHVEAGKIFEKLLSANTSENVRNKAWFYLGKVWYQRGYLQESERALNKVSDRIQPRISAERYMLLAQLMLREDRYDDAIAALAAWPTRSPTSIRWVEWRRRAKSCSRSRTRPISRSDSPCCRRSVPPMRGRYWSG
jgi:predicted Zn-dependent protease